jgi:chemotaxis protein MotD
MMPGIAIQTGLPTAGSPAARSASTAGGNRFSDALHGTPREADRAEDAAGRTVRQGRGGEEKKVDRSAHAKDDRDDTEDQDGTKKDKDDRTGDALPPHMQAERTLARQWPASAPATAHGSTPAGKPDGGAVVHTPAGALATGPDMASTADAAAPAGKPEISALNMASAPTRTVTAGQAAKGDAPRFEAPATTSRTTADPALKGAAIAAAATVETGKATPGDPSAAFMARITALQHGADPATPKAGVASATDPEANAAPRILRFPAGQNSGNTGADADGQRGRNGGKAAQNAAQPTAGAKGNASATPLPTAQMFPVSGSATSFAGVLAQGGALARYTSSAAAAIAAGVPAGSLPAQSLSIQLRPVELGAVTANLKYAGSGLTIDIQVETAEAHRRLSNDSSDIVKSLQSLGFQVDKVTVRQASAQPQGQPQGQAQGQTTGRDGSAAGFAGQGGAHSSMSGQSGAGGRRQDTENRHDRTADRGVGMVQQAADRLPRRGVFI